MTAEELEQLRLERIAEETRLLVRRGTHPDLARTHAKAIVDESDPVVLPTGTWGWRR